MSTLPTYNTAMRRVRERGWILTEKAYVKGILVLHMVSPTGAVRAVRCKKP